MGKADRRYSRKMRQRKGRSKLKARQRRQAAAKRETRKNTSKAAASDSE